MTDGARKLVTPIQFKELMQPTGILSGDQRLHVCAYVGGIKRDIKIVDGDIFAEFIISDESIDRGRDKVKASGWDFRNWLPNPVVQYGHQSHNPPVAMGVEIGVEGTNVISTCKFTPKDMYPFGGMIGEMVANGFLSATSVGFSPTKWVFVDDEGRAWGIDFEEQELLEWSICNVPMNANALLLSFTDNDVDMFEQAKAKSIDIDPAIGYAQEFLDTKSNGSKDERAAFEKLHELASGGTCIFIHPKDNPKAVVKFCGEKSRLIGAFIKEMDLPPLEEMQCADTCECEKCSPATPSDFIPRAKTYDEAHKDGCPVLGKDAPWDTDFTGYKSIHTTITIEIADDEVERGDHDDENEKEIELSRVLVHHDSKGCLNFTGLALAMRTLCGSGSHQTELSALGKDVRGQMWEHLARHYSEDFDMEPPKKYCVEQQVLSTMGEMFGFDMTTGNIVPKSADDVKTARTLAAEKQFKASAKLFIEECGVDYSTAIALFEKFVKSIRGDEESKSRATHDGGGSVGMSLDEIEGSLSTVVERALEKEVSEAITVETGHLGS